MSDEHAPPHRPSHSPTWWPQGEPWPPSGPPNRQHWRGMRGKFLRRVGCSFALLITLMVAILTALVWLFASSLGVIDLSEGTLAVLRVASSALLVFGLVSILLAGLWLRRTALPVGDLMEAVGRVADGDYSVRLAERGPKELRRLSQRFNRMAQRLQALDEERRNRLAEVSHELRTPITVIQGNLEGILDGLYPADRDHIGAILDETHVLSRLVDDLRTLSLAESGALRLRIERTSIGELIEDVAGSFQGRAHDAGVRLRVAVQPGLPEVDMDPTRIREVLTNLVSNALHHSPQGGQVEMKAWMKAGEDDRLHVSVTDQGAGIAPEDLPHIFERFYKSAQSHGSGLGLAIAQSLIQAHDGEIFAESKTGRGAKLEFTLPAG